MQQSLIIGAVAGGVTYYASGNNVPLAALVGLGAYMLSKRSEGPHGYYWWPWRPVIISRGRSHHW